MITPAAQEIIDEIDRLFHEAFKDFDNGIFEVKFMSMGREPEISPRFTPEGQYDSKSAMKMLLEEVGLNTITKLREAMCDKGGKGSWLSGVAKFDCLTEEFTVEFNYDRRFNVLAENWIYDEDDDEVFPDRRTLIADFDKCPRNIENIPDWIEDLKQEQKEINVKIEKAVAEEVFAEQVEAAPSIYEKFETVAEYAVWREFWEEVGETYVETMLNDKNLIPLFVDDSRAKEQASYIFNELEPKVVSNYLEYAMSETEPDDRANLLNILQISLGEPANHECEYDEKLDLEMLEEDFEDVVVSMVMSQTQQRFPDLEEVMH